MQQRILRDIAEKWHGELRTDPISAFMGRRLTVHPQGGCAMGRVTGIDGQVINCPGLYVMDAASFPKSVGVNPSATILAVAEYKVEQFIRKGKKEDAEWRARHFECAQSWMDCPEHQRRKDLDPLAQISSPSRARNAEPIGIRFHEMMQGSCRTVAGSQRYAVEVELDAEIQDLSWFLGRYEKGRPPKIAVTRGTLKLDQVEHTVGGGSSIRLFRKPVSRAGGDTRLIEYELALKSNGGPSYLIRGRKTLYDTVGEFDLWDKVSLMQFTMDRNGQPFAEGELKVPPDKFFAEQLASFEATNTEDPVRQLWALAAFGKLFFGHLLDLYLPEVKTLRQAAKRIAERAHV
jgi:hypothetical protein